MASRGVVGVFLLSALPLLCLELRRGIPDIGIKDLILLCGRVFLLLALLTLIISMTASLLNSFKSPQAYLKEEEEENEKRQKLVRKKQQEAQGEKASRYIENVLKPHQEMRLKKLEERFYQMTGETWKLTSGHKLGGDEEMVLQNASQTSFETTNREAAKRRNLAKPLTEVRPSAEEPSQKQVPDLPEEPSETNEEMNSTNEPHPKPFSLFETGSWEGILTGLKLGSSCLSLPEWPGLQACATMPSLESSLGREFSTCTVAT